MAKIPTGFGPRHPHPVKGGGTSSYPFMGKSEAHQRGNPPFERLWSPDISFYSPPCLRNSASTAEALGGGLRRTVVQRQLQAMAATGAKVFFVAAVGDDSPGRGWPERGVGLSVNGGLAPINGHGSVPQLRKVFSFFEKPSNFFSEQCFMI